MKTAPARGTTVPVPLPGRCPVGLEALGTAPGRGRPRAHPDLDFLMLAGDLVDRGNERTNWDHFFLRAARGLRPRAADALRRATTNISTSVRGSIVPFFELPPTGRRASSRTWSTRSSIGDACVAVLDSTLAVSDPDAAGDRPSGSTGLAQTRADLEARDVPSPGLRLAPLAR